MIEKAILIGPFIGELGWEILRFSPLIPYYYKKHHKQNVKFIIFTRQDRFDLYGQYADILVPLRIKGDGTLFKADCFRLTNFPVDEYKKLTSKFNKHYQKRFDIIEHIYPILDGKNFAKKQQFSKNGFKYIYQWKPRIKNKKSIDEHVSNNKKCIVLAPRFRKGLRRNWPYWKEFYNLIAKDKYLMQNYNFIICGKNPDYIPDKKNRFYDINNIESNDDVSLIGLTIESIKKSILTVGSQSGIPNISMLLGIESLMWGHQKSLHAKIYNVKKTNVHFLDDMKYKLEPISIFKKMKKIIRNVENKTKH